jgi:hypothetical protein
MQEHAMTITRSCLLTLCLGLAACKPYHLLHESDSPSALADADRMSVRFDSSMLLLGPEPRDAFLARKTPEQRLEFEQVMLGFETGFMTALPRWAGEDIVVHYDEPMPGELLLTIVPVYMRLGKFTYMYDETTELAVRCLWSRDGVRLDEIETQTLVEPSALQPAAHQRVEYAAKLLARICATYVKRAR